MQNSKNVSVITLRTGKQIQIHTLPPSPIPTPELHKQKDDLPQQEEQTCTSRKFDAGGPSSSSINTCLDLHQLLIPFPFSPKVIQSKNMEEVDKEIPETFRKVEVYIPLLDVIK